mgnify:CR=1 FL=1
MGYISELRKHIGHNPLICAGATVAVIKDKQILLNLRSDTKTWGIPGGSLEIGETLEETAKRELKEETNLDCDNFTLLNVFSGNDFYFKYPNGDELYSVIALYLADDFKGSLKITDDESIDLSFFSKSELPNLESRAKLIIDWLIEKEYI